MNHDYRVVVIGGGIIGLATAMRLIQQSDRLPKITVLEAESAVGRHQSGHNSGVLHSGVYYKPGSIKAITCRKGKEMMESFCLENSIPFQRCGKVIVATDESELESLDRIALRGQENGVRCDRINSDQLRRIEPHAAGIAGLYVPETGIVDYGRVCQVMADKIRELGGTVQTGFRVTGIKRASGSVEISSDRGQVLATDQMINCGGLYCDRIFRLAGGETSLKIVPFRGEYYSLVAGRDSLCRNLIYPVPDPKFPFLGVHFTRMIDGGVECGPNAVLAFSRKGYRWRDINFRDLFETIRFKGFRKLAAQHWKMGLKEMHRSLRKAAFTHALQRLVPEVRSEDLRPIRAGVRAQAVTSDGKLLDDFCIESTPDAVHVLNAPSPAATASLAIADRIIAAARANGGL
jgi:(S)-2-hydroxyglutarate dehydrogenase